MDAVADHLRIKLILGKNCPQNPRLAMIQRPHGVEGMRRADGSGSDNRAGLGGGSVRVAHGDANAAADGVRSQFRCAGQLGRKRHQPDATLGSVKEPVKGGYVGRQQVLGRLHAALGVRKKRPFQMNTDGTSLPCNRRLRQQLCQPGERPQRCIQRRGDGSSQKAARAMLGQKSAHGAERLSRGLHHIVALGPVNMHIEKRRPQRRAGKVKNPRLAWQLAVRARGDGGNAAVFNHHHRAVQ